MKSLKNNRWFIAILIGIAGGVSFELAYLKYNYQPAMEKFMGLSATEVGVIMSVFGFSSMFLYAPSGVIADKFNHKKLITYSMIVTGLLGFIMAIYPPYWVMILIQIFWAISTVLFMWSATLKAVTILGTKKEQGALLGVSEGARGGGNLVFAFLTLWIFKIFGAENNSFSLKAVIITYSAIMIVLGVLCWVFIPDIKSETNNDNKESVHKKENLKTELAKVLKRKTTWLCSLIILGVYTVYACLSYTASYLIDIFGLTVTVATFIGIIRNQLMRTFCPPLGGMITRKTKLKSPTKLILLSSIINLIALLILSFSPNNHSLLYGIIGIILVSAICVYVCRGIYFATIGEIDTPIEITGTTIGIASVIGFLPDGFIYIIIGRWQDTLPAIEAYRRMWLTGSFGMFITIISAFLLLKEIKKIEY